MIDDSWTSLDVYVRGDAHLPGKGAQCVMLLSKIGAVALHSEGFLFFLPFRLQKLTSFSSLPATVRLPRPASAQSVPSPFSSLTRATRLRAFEWGSEVSNCCPSTARGLRPGRPAYLFLLKWVAPAAASPSSRRLVTALHCHILKSGFLDDVVLATALVDTLARCSDLDGARKLFDGMCARDVASWNAMLSGYSRNGSAQHALILFRKMLLSGKPPNSATLSIILQVCSGLDDKIPGRCVHCYIIRHPGVGDTFLHDSLLVYYSRLGDVHIAEKLFERMETRNVVTWNAMISGYAMNDYPHEALETFHHMRQEGPTLDLVTLETVLQACALVGEEAFKNGESIHALLIRLGFAMDVYTENSLLFMYCKCDGVHLGQRLFDGMVSRNIVSWNILINGYAKKQFPERVLTLFKSVRFVVSEINSDLVVGALKAVKILSEYPELVMCFHCLVIVLGFTSDEFVIGSLISAYGESMDVANATRCFDFFLPANSMATVLWNTLLSVYLHNGYLLGAVDILHCMQTEHSKADAITLVNALSVCAQLPDMKLGKAVHAYIIRNAFEPNIFVTTSLLDFYSRCGLLCKACWLFLKMPLRTTASWNTMIFGCLQNGFPRVSLSLFHLMRQLEGVKLDATTVVGVIEAITWRGQDREGDYIHRYAIQRGFGNNEFVANSLISMYSRFGNLDMARMVFDGVTGHSKIMWNALISEYSRHRMSEQAISVFCLMKLNSICPDAISLLSVLPACAHLASLSYAMWIHTNILKTGCESDVFVVTSLLDVYAKCGELDVAQLIFNNMRSKTAVSWNSIIHTYGMHGHVEEAGKLFSEMQRFGMKPDCITFLVLISACAHAGEVEKGLDYYNLMTGAYSLTPRIEHYSCIVDLLGRRGLINEAFEFLEKIPLFPEKCAWGSLLGACRVQGKIEMALMAAKKLFELDPLAYGYHMLLSNVLLESGMWMDACEIRKKLKVMGHKKVQGLSMVET